VLRIYPPLLGAFSCLVLSPYGPLAGHALTRFSSKHTHTFFSSPAGIDSRRWSWAGAESAVQDPADPRPGPCSSLVLFLLLFYFLDLISVNAHAAHGLIFGRDHLFLSLTPMVCACSGFGVIRDARAARLSSKY